MKKENDREPRAEEVEVVHEEVNCVSREDVKIALMRMKRGKAVRPDQLPVKVWKCMRERWGKVFDHTVQQIISR